MCGICGLAVAKGRGTPPDVTLVRRMCETIRHRGPDDSGEYVGAQIGLGHRRLAIVDLAGGHQPMTDRPSEGNEGTRLWIAFNGEIYNHEDLRRELQAHGYHFSTRSDTESILHLFRDRGLAALQCLRGMYAFALWDESSGSLVLARDRIGIKPLYYSLAADGTIAFGSEIKAVIASGVVEPRFNEEGLPEYLAQHATAGAETLYKNVLRVEPGTAVVWKDGVVATHRHWHPSFRANERASEKSAAAMSRAHSWRDVFDDAVKSHLMSDVPLGVFLSGGIDSSAIATSMYRQTGRTLKTFSVGFAEQGANEFEYARVVAKHIRSEHYELVLSPHEYFASLPRMIWHEDEPIGHVASVPLYHIARLAAQHVKVVLTGEGSDELLGGYSKYGRALQLLRVARVYQSVVPESIRRALARRPSNGRRHTNVRAVLDAVLRSGDTFEGITQDPFAVFSWEQQQSLLSERVRNAAVGRTGAGLLPPYGAARRVLAETDAPDDLARLLHIDMMTYLQELLMKQDQMSMAASVESRVPFLDNEVMSYSMQLPSSAKLKHGRTKLVLREAMRADLPEGILARGKMGFPVPVSAWLRGPFHALVQEFILSPRALRRDLFRVGPLRQLVAEHQQGVRDHGQRLWALLNLEIWQRMVSDGNPWQNLEAEMASLLPANADAAVRAVA
jgi:asparagine synthase (glutamine-hydrolysing)